MQLKIYLETTIPSFYHEDRTDIAAIARREWTRQWWTAKRQNYELVTSVAVLNELENGDYPKKENCLSLLSDLSVVTIETEIIDIVEIYIQDFRFPSFPRRRESSKLLKRLDTRFRGYDEFTGLAKVLT